MLEQSDTEQERKEINLIKHIMITWQVQAGISATEKSMVKERLGLTGGSQHQEGMAYGMYKGSGKPSGPMAAFGKKKTKKTKPTITVTTPDRLTSFKSQIPHSV